MRLVNKTIDKNFNWHWRDSLVGEIKSKSDPTLNTLNWIVSYRMTFTFDRMLTRYPIKRRYKITLKDGTNTSYNSI